MKQPVFLRIYKGDELVEVKQFDQQQVVIGKNGDLDIALQDQNVSPIHAMIEERDSGYYVSDLGSQLGTFHNGEKTFDGQLNSGDELTIGAYKIQFFIGIPKPVQPPQAAAKPGAAGLSSDKAVSGETKIIPPVPGKAHEAAAVTPESEISLDEETATGIVSEENEITREIPIDGDTKRISLSELEKLDEASQPASSSAGGTFAPSSEVSDLSEIIKPDKGPIVEVIVAWKERILSTNHFSEKGIVYIGSDPNCDIVVPLLGVEMGRYPLLSLDALAIIKVLPTMGGHFVRGNKTEPLGDLIKQNRLVSVGGHYEMQLGQGELLNLQLEDGLINVYIRYVPETPKPIAAPLLDLTTSEAAGVVAAIAVALIFALYMAVYAPGKLEDENRVEEPIRKAIVKFTPPTPPKKVEVKQETVPTQKKIVKVTEKSKKAEATTKKEPGQAAQVKPKETQTKKKVVTSARPGGSKKMGKEASSAKTVEVDPTQVGLLGAFAGRGMQQKLDKAATGAGSLMGLADQQTGRSGMGEDRPGDRLGTRGFADGAGGKGSSTVGIGDVGIKGGRGTGNFGSGVGGIGQRGRVDVNIGGDDAEFEGTIDREAIRRVILANKRAIKACYERALTRNRGLSGKLVLQWNIEERGRVTAAKVVSNQLDDTVSSCIIQRLKTWKFPEPPADQIAQVQYPFVFSSQ